MTTQNGSFLATRRGGLTLLLLCAVAVPRRRRFLDHERRPAVDPPRPGFLGAGPALGAVGVTWSPTADCCCWAAGPATCSAGGALLAAGTVLFAACSLAGGLAVSAGMLVGARLGQGAGAAMMAPAGLSILTTTFKRGTDRNRALGVWGAVSGLAAAAGVFLGRRAVRRARAGGGCCSSTSGRALILGSARVACCPLSGDRARAPRASTSPAPSLSPRDAAARLRPGAGTAAVGWGSARTIGEIATAGSCSLPVRRD